MPEEASRIQAFLGGDADLVDLSSREVAETQIKGQPGIVFHGDMPRLSAYGFSLNQDLSASDTPTGGEWGTGVPDNFFADANMRRCFTYAFDNQAFIDQVLSGQGTHQNAMLPDTFLGYDGNVEPQAYDPAQAEEFCKAAHDGQAWEQGFTLTAAYLEGYTENQTALEMLKQNLETMNPKFRINMVGKPLGDFLTAVDVEPMGQVGWGPDYADPDNFIRTFYHSKGFYAPLFSLNDPELDAWTDEAATITDEAERTKLYGQVAERARDEGYYINLPVGRSFLAYHNDLSGMEPQNYNPLYGYYWKNLSKSE